MRFRKGFTLVEVITVAIIFSVLSTLVLFDFRTAGRKQRLQGTADEMASRIKQAQGLAYSNTKQIICSSDQKVCLSGSACDAGYPTNCTSQYIPRYGVRFDTDGTRTKYMIGADYSGYGGFTVNEAIPGGIMNLPSGIVIDSVTPAQVADQYDLNYIYDSSNASPFIPCASGCLTTVVLRDTISNATRTVTIQKQTGIVSGY